MSNPAEEFESMMFALTCTDNSIRKHAEASYADTKKKNPKFLFIALQETTLNTTKMEVKHICLVELRKILTDAAFSFSIFDSADINTIKQRALALMGDVNATSKIRQMASECVACIADELYDSTDTQHSQGHNFALSGWSELWGLLMQTMTDPSQPAETICACSHVFANIDENTIEQALSTQHKALAFAFEKSIKQSNTKVSTHIINDFSLFITFVAANAEKSYMAILPLILEVFARALNQSEVPEAEEIGKAVISLIESNPSICKAFVVNMLNGMLDVASNNQVPKELRHVATEALLTLCETHANSVRKAGFAEKIFQLLFSYCQHPEFAEDWDNTEEAKDNEDEHLEGSEDCDVALTGIERWIESLNPKHVRDIASKVIMANINSPIWQHRYAALSTLTYIFEQCKDHFKKDLKVIMGFVYPLTKDECKYVRSAAVLCLSQCCIDFSPYVQKKEHDRLIPCLLSCTTDVPRISHLAINTISTFFELSRDTEMDVMTDKETKLMQMLANTYVGTIVKQFMQIFESSHRFFIRKEIIECLGLIAEAVERFSAPFVKFMVPPLQFILNATDEELPYSKMERDKLRCIALQTFTLLAASVRLPGFAEFAPSLCELLLSLLKQNLPYEDPRAQYVIRGWTCMAECMKAEIKPYLEIVLPHIIQLSDKQCNIEVLGNENGIDELSSFQIDEKKDTILSTVDSPGKGLTTVRLKTAEIDEKVLGLDVLYQIGKELMETDLFIPYIETICKVAINAMGFAAQASVRESAVDLAGGLLNIAVNRAKIMVPALISFLAPQVIARLDQETDLDIISNLIYLLKEIFEECSVNTLDGNIAQKAVDFLINTLKKELEYQKTGNYAKNRLDNESDDNSISDLSDQNQLGATAECLGELIKKVPSYAAAYPSEVLQPIVVHMMSPNSTSTILRAGLILLLSYIETEDAGIIHVIPQCMAWFNQYALHDNQDVAQTSMFSLGVSLEKIAKLCPSQITFYSKTIYQTLQQFWNIHPSFGYDEDSLESKFDEVKTNVNINSH